MPCVFLRAAPVMRVFGPGLAALLLVSAPLPAAPSPDFVVVVHKENPVGSLPVAELQRVFRKQTRMWPHGEAVVPVDWDATSDVRREFSKRVFGRSVREMSEFWVQQNITQGLNPPSTLKSTRAVLRFVVSVPGAIAYVPAGEADETVKTIEIKGLR
jgi:ABC-type phosphate transport system substrate-binding protein